jgi:hypothetical protein
VIKELICVYEDDTNGGPLKVFGDFAEIYVDLTLHLEDCSYGVPGSPIWTEIFDYTVTKVYVNEDEYAYKEFNKKFPDYVVEEVDKLIDDAVDNLSIY